MCLKNGNWNEIAAVWVTFFQRFSQHRDILMHHLTVTSLPFLSWTHRKAFSDGPQIVCPSCSVWRWQMQGFALAMPWLGWEWLEMTNWDCRSSAMSQSCLCFLGAPFQPQQAAPHPQLPGAPQLQTAPFSVMGHLQELPPGLWCSPEHASCWWVDGFQVTCQVTIYTLLKQNPLTFKVSIWN